MTNLSEISIKKWNINWDSFEIVYNMIWDSFVVELGQFLFLGVDV